MPNITKKHPYTGKKLKAALMMSEGLKSQRDISEELDMHESTISKWKHDPDFAAFVDKMTLEHENASRAGLLREAYKGLGIKRGNIKQDKSSHLDYVKEIANIQGLKTQKIEHSGEVTQNAIIYLPENNRDTIPEHNNNQ